jgi:hypothetical protein
MPERADCGQFSRMLEKEFIVEMQEKDLNEFIR